MNDDLPEGWASATLSDVAQVGLGRTPRKDDYRDSGRNRMVKFRDLTPRGLDFSAMKSAFVADDVASAGGLARLRVGDVLLTASAHSGDQIGKKTVFVDSLPSEDAFWFVGELLCVTAVPNLMEPRWPYLWFLSEPGFREVQEAVCGVHLTTGRAQSIPLPIPPLAEQHRIVIAVEALLARVNAAKERLERVPGILKRFRQAVLAAACSGELTADTRLPSACDAGELPVGWRQMRLVEVASREPRSIQSGPFGSNLKHSEFVHDGRLVIGIDNVGDGVFLEGRQHRIREGKFRELQRYAARPGDVLITVMATVGRVCVVPDDIGTAIITKHVYRISCDQDVMLPGFLACALRGDPNVADQVREQVRGQTRPGINGEIVKSLILPVPPLVEQSEILRRAAILLARADAATRTVAVTSTRVGALQQAVLAKAFRGELVPTEAELARQEGREYESAEEILRRVNAASESAVEGSGSQRRRKRTREVHGG